MLRDKEEDDDTRCFTSLRQLYTSNASCMLWSYRSHVCTYGITQDKETLKSQPNSSHKTNISPLHRTEPVVFKRKKKSTLFDKTQSYSASSLQGQNQWQLSAAAELVFCQAPFKLAFSLSGEACWFCVSPEPLTEKRGVGGDLWNNQDLFGVLRMDFRMCVLMRPLVL